MIKEYFERTTTRMNRYVDIQNIRYILNKNEYCYLSKRGYITFDAHTNRKYVIYRRL